MKAVGTKWETFNIERGIIQRRNDRAQEPCMAITVYLVGGAKSCIVDCLQVTAGKSQPKISSTYEMFIKKPVRLHRRRDRVSLVQCKHSWSQSDLSEQYPNFVKALKSKFEENVDNLP